MIFDSPTQSNPTKPSFLENLAKQFLVSILRESFKIVLTNDKTQNVKVYVSFKRFTRQDIGGHGYLWSALRCG